jgi:hypothetical protein
VGIHCPARYSRDQNLLNSSGNLHYFVGTGIGGWFAETIHVGNALRFAFERLWDEPIAREVRKQYPHGPCVVKPFESLTVSSARRDTHLATFGILSPFLATRMTTASVLAITMISPISTVWV